MRIAEQLRADLAGFVEQRDALTLVLWTKSPHDAMFAQQLLDSLDQTSTRDVFILYAADCVDVASYLDGLVAALDSDVYVGNEAIRQGLADEGMEAWDSFPLECFDSTLRPLARIQALIGHIRAHIPDPTHRIVFGLLPTALTNPDAYAELARQLIPWNGYEPWMAGVRFVLRDAQRDPKLVGQLIEEDAFGTLVRPVDFSADAMSASIVATADDKSAPPDERMAAFVQVAGMDQAWGRHEEAIRKYTVAGAYYGQEGNVPMQALCVLHVGYAEQLVGRREVARTRFRQAMSLAMANDIKQVVLNATLALAQMHHEEEDWSGAAAYWEGTCWMARALNNVFVLADACQQAGVCQVALNATDRALEYWDAGQKVAEEVAYWKRAAAILSYRVDIEARLGRREDEAKHKEQLQVALHELEKQGREVAEAQRAAQQGAAPQGVAS